MASHKDSQFFEGGKSQNAINQNGASHGGWGRAWKADWFSLISVIFLLFSCPFIVYYFVMSCDQYHCSLSEPAIQLLTGKVHLLDIWDKTPSFSWKILILYFSWVIFQGFLFMIPDFCHKFIPGFRGGVQEGAISPA
ncbi:7-dehydrocholesterol reductase-like, partial [Protobothrops mucrosquamatus]|uniref:7-dehydrocholesterol reductase-like n=1 Tax=Protobothrops mucrosquamatus TaxID=103944 RepID=UPI000775B705